MAQPHGTHSGAGGAPSEGTPTLCHPTAGTGTASPAGGVGTPSPMGPPTQGTLHPPRGTPHSPRGHPHPWDPRPTQGTPHPPKGTPGRGDSPPRGPPTHRGDPLTYETPRLRGPPSQGTPPHPGPPQIGWRGGWGCLGLFWGGPIGGGGPLGVCVGSHGFGGWESGSVKHPGSPNPLQGGSLQHLGSPPPWGCVCALCGGLGGSSHPGGVLQHPDPSPGRCRAPPDPRIPPGRFVHPRLRPAGGVPPPQTPGPRPGRSGGAEPVPGAAPPAAAGAAPGVAAGPAGGGGGRESGASRSIPEHPGAAAPPWRSAPRAGRTRAALTVPAPGNTPPLLPRGSPKRPRFSLPGGSRWVPGSRGCTAPGCGAMGGTSGR